MHTYLLMNDRQQQVAAASISFLILVIVFLCPWRVESSGEIQWSPIYQPPMSYERSYDKDYGSQGGSRIKLNEADIAVGVLSLEVLVIVVVGGMMYLYFADSGESNEH